MGLEHKVNGGGYRRVGVDNVSVPFRGNGFGTLTWGQILLSYSLIPFPSPFGVMGLEHIPLNHTGFRCNVSVPFRGNGFGTQVSTMTQAIAIPSFPSPFGVMGLEHLHVPPCTMPFWSVSVPFRGNGFGTKKKRGRRKLTPEFPSPFGVMGLEQ